MKQNCSKCNIKIEEIIYLKAKPVHKRCYNKNRRKNKNNTLIQSLQSNSDNNYDNNKKIRRVVDSMNNNNNRTLTIGISNCGKTYVMNHILLTKQEQVFIITKSSTQYPQINSQTSDETQPLENFENSIVVSDDIIQSKQETNIDKFFTRGRHNI